jgi:hypothetical protein
MMRLRWRSARGEFAHEQTAPGDGLAQTPMRCGIQHVETAAQHADRHAADVQRATMSGAVDATRQPARHDEPGPADFTGQMPGGGETCLGRQSRAHDGHGGVREQVETPPGPEDHGRVRNLPEERRIRGFRRGQHGDALSPGGVERPAGPLEGFTESSPALERCHPQNGANGFERAGGISQARETGRKALPECAGGARIRAEPQQ